MPSAIRNKIGARCTDFILCGHNDRTYEKIAVAIFANRATLILSNQERRDHHVFF